MIKQEIQKDKLNLKIKHTNGTNSENYKKSIEEKNFLLDEIDREIYRLRCILAGSSKQEEKIERKVPTIPCSVNSCRGFLDSIEEEKDYKCGICSVVHCNKCRSVKEDEHKCDKNTLETIKLLKKDTKPCPKCNVPIFKTEGCDQMWCVQCHTAFSWKTGNIESGHVHNPHYWQYLQSQGRDLEAVRRMQNPNAAFVARQGQRCVDMRDLVHAVPSNKISSLCHRLQHLRYHDIQARRNEQNYIDRNRDLRKRYLLNDLNETNFKKVLMMREKRASYNIEITQVLNMLYDTSNDILASVYRDNHYKRKEYYKEIMDAINEIDNLATYTKEQANKISDRYGYKFDRDIVTTLNSILEATDKNMKLGMTDRSGKLW